MFVFIVIIIINILLLYTSTNFNVFVYAQKPDTKPKPAPKPVAAKPVPKPVAAKPVAKPAAKPVAKPAAKPAAKSSAKLPSQLNGKPPTVYRLQNAIDFFKRYPNHIDNPPNAYKGLIELGYIKKDGNTLGINTSPGGLPPARIWWPSTSGTSGGNKPSSGGSGGGGSASGGSKPSSGTGGSGGNKPSSGGKIPQNVAQGGIVNWSWSGENSGDKQTHGNTTYKGEQIIMMDMNAPQSKIDEARKRVGPNGQVIGYMSAGSIEEWRLKDMKNQGYKGPGPSNEAIGDKMKGWNGEKWVDPKKWDKAMPFIQGQMDFMKQRGFTSIEVDNMSIDNNCGNKSCRDANMQFAGAVADAAKSRGMKIFMKNGSGFADVDKSYMPQLAKKFDGLITEQANQYKEASVYKPFADAGKPWYNFEYRNPGQTCQTTGGQTSTYFQTDGGWKKC